MSFVVAHRSYRKTITFILRVLTVSFVLKAGHVKRIIDIARIPITTTRAIVE